MWREALVERLRSDWYILVAALVLLAAAVYLAVGERSGAEVDSASVEAAAPAEDTERLEVGMEVVDYDQIQRERRTAEVRETIASHAAMVDEAPESEDAPGYLAAMGNLYMLRLEDYEQAAECYERVLVTYPEWSGIQRVYLNLANCYTAIGDLDRRDDVYRRMAQHFPEDSQEHIFALHQLSTSFEPEM